MDIVSSQKVKIRKQHNCWGCTKLFMPKTELQLVKCSEDGRIYSVYWCEFCQSVLTKRFEYYDTFAYGELKDTQEYQEVMELGL